MTRAVTIHVLLAGLICFILTACPQSQIQNPKDQEPQIEQTEEPEIDIPGEAEEETATDPEQVTEEDVTDTASETPAEEEEVTEEEPAEEEEPVEEEEPMAEEKDIPENIFADYETWPPDSITDEEVEILERVVVVFETTQGIIKIRVFPEQAPIHSANFVKLVQDGFYDGSPFHRVIKDFMSQGGGRPDGSDSGYVIPEEIGLPHKAGSIAAARTNNPQKNSSGSQFYFVHTDTSATNLDRNYTVYGEIVEGLDVNLSLSVNATGSGPIPGVEPDSIIRAWVEMG